VKVCLDSDINIIGEAFATSPTIGAEQQEYFNDKNIANMEKHHRNSCMTPDKFWNGSDHDRLSEQSLPLIT